MALYDPVKESIRQKAKYQRIKADPVRLKNKRRKGFVQKGMVFDDYDVWYDRYITATHCELCYIEYTGHRTKAMRSMDHCHHSGCVRSVCCHSCNKAVEHTDRSKMKVHLELYRTFALK